MKAVKEFIKRALPGERVFPANVFGRTPRASREAYLQLHEEARKISYPEIDAFEQRQGYAINREWLESVALHTQVVVKKSQLNYQHGRLLYAALRCYLRDCVVPVGGVNILETGTARGFSALCMARALLDAKVAGKILTLDILPHNTPMLWNCIDDHDGPKSRQQLLAPWPDELANIIFIQGWTKTQLARTGLSRIHFAFLDAQHTTEDVMLEYSYVRDRQQTNDVIVFDDVTPGFYDGVIQAVAEIEREGLYTVERLAVSRERGYAIGVRQ